MSLSLNNTEAGTKLNGGLVNNLRFADDIGLLTRSEQELQDITTKIDETSRRFGLMINAEKTKTMVIEKIKETPITINIQGETRKIRLFRRADKLRWQQRKRNTKENWTYFASIWKNE